MRRRLGDDELIAEITRLFLADCPVRLAEIKAAVDARDRDAIRTAAHALKGAAGELSAAPVAECARALERMAEARRHRPDAGRCRMGKSPGESARLVQRSRAVSAWPREALSHDHEREKRG